MNGYMKVSAMCPHMCGQPLVYSLSQSKITCGSLVLPGAPTLAVHAFVKDGR